MWTIKTVETPDRILVTGRGGGGIIFFVCLFGIAFLLWITLKLDSEEWIFTILICVGLGLLALFLFFQPNKIISEFDLNKRKVFIRKTHFILNFSAEEIRFEDIESIESEYNGSTRKTHLIVNLKDQPVEKDLGTVRCAEELQEKLKQFIGLPDL